MILARPILPRSFSIQQSAAASTSCRSYPLTSTIGTLTQAGAGALTLHLHRHGRGIALVGRTSSRGSWRAQAVDFRRDFLAGFGFLAFMAPGKDDSYWATFFRAATILWMRGRPFVAPLTTTAMNSVPVEHSGVASGIDTRPRVTARADRRQRLWLRRYGLGFAHCRLSQRIDRLGNFRLRCERVIASGGLSPALTCLRQVALGLRPPWEVGALSAASLRS